VQQTAELLLKERVQTASIGQTTLGQRWVYRFINRHPEIKSRYSRKYDYKRAKCEDPKVIQAWFRPVQNTVAKYGILAEDIYNFDETVFQMGVISTAKVIQKAGIPSRTIKPLISDRLFSFWEKDSGTCIPMVTIFRWSR
jgi:hypothetical protein